MWHSPAVDPHTAPAFQVFRRFPVQDGDQIFPGGVSVSELLQIGTDAFAEGFRPHPFNQHVHYNGGFVVDDIPVDQAGFGQVVQGLLDGVGTGGPVHGVSSSVKSAQVVQAVVDTGKLRTDHLGGKIIGKHFFGPDIVKPVHGHVIPKPHVCCFVGYQGHAA